MNNKTSSKNLKDEWEKIIMLLVPLVPHIAHEFVEKINKKFYWPKYDPKLLKEENCSIVIQVDGRKRGMIEIQKNLEEKVVINKCKEIENVSKYIINTKIMKNIYIKNKLINFITKK
jgi:leucyl-tRNA synthetase